MKTRRKKRRRRRRRRRKRRKRSTVNEGEGREFQCDRGGKLKHTEEKGT
jgi:hypothetical protein